VLIFFAGFFNHPYVTLNDNDAVVGNVVSDGVVFYLAYFGTEVESTDTLEFYVHVFLVGWREAWRVARSSRQ
jgi:hypothetical protein